MRFFAVLLVAGFVFGTCGAAFADVYDEVWVKQCIEDNQDQGQARETIAVYCKCMNEHMPSSESRSITTWEKSHPDEMEFCSDVAGWRGR